MKNSGTWCPGQNEMPVNSQNRFFYEKNYVLNVCNYVSQTTIGMCHFSFMNYVGVYILVLFYYCFIRAEWEQ